MIINACTYGKCNEDISDYSRDLSKTEISARIKKAEGIVRSKLQGK